MNLPGFFKDYTMAKSYCYSKAGSGDQQSTYIQPADVPCIYGNWCGPGCGGGDIKDDVDNCCKKHDDCYDRNGYFCCSCDRKVVQCVTPKINPFTAKGRAAAAVAAYFTSTVATGSCRPGC